MGVNVNGPYISKVRIKNFRNFNHEEVDLSHKQVIIGENNIGKTNFLRAIQLILDPKLSDDDRNLIETDFYEGLDSPMENGEEIEISIDIRGFDHNKNLLSILSDGTIEDNPCTIRLTYRYYATLNNDGTYTYQYKILQGNSEEIQFTHYHRRFLNIKVIPPIRDVEAELRNKRKSPINQLIKEYDIKQEELEQISEGLKETSEEVLTIDELKHLTESINNRYSKIIGQQVTDTKLSLETMDLDPNRILNSLKIMLGNNKRPTSDTSLGLTNILYISLVLLSLEDKTIPAILQEDTYDRLILEEDSNVLKTCYTQKKSSKYRLNNDMSAEDYERLYSFMEDHLSSNKGLTILAIEEPESHLHPALQRIIYKDVMKSNTSVLMTTHSPYITSVAPLNSIVHLRLTERSTSIKATASLELNDRNQKDLERYIDVKKGEIYFGKGVILVEGIAEEYLIPKFADLLGYHLDDKGIICCNINSTNFYPYVQYLETLGIPYVLVTDGDYYYNKMVKDKNGKTKKKKAFHEMFNEGNHELGFGYEGLERTKELLVDLEIICYDEILEDIDEEYEFYRESDVFIGMHTLEVDMMKVSAEKKSIDVWTQTFDDLTAGGNGQKENFKNSLQTGDFVACLRRIESNYSKIGKGRFAQALSAECNKNNIPEYIEAAIERIYFKVDDGQ